jgi:hypothetical protein
MSAGTFQIKAVESSLAASKRLPSGVNANALMPLRWASNRQISRRPATSQSRIIVDDSRFPSLVVYCVAKIRPSGEKHRAFHVSLEPSTRPISLPAMASIRKIEPSRRLDAATTLLSGEIAAARRQGFAVDGKRHGGTSRRQVRPKMTIAVGPSRR